MVITFFSPLCKNIAFPTTSSNEFRKDIKICCNVCSTYSGCDGFTVNYELNTEQAYEIKSTTAALVVNASSVAETDQTNH